MKMSYETKISRFLGFSKADPPLYVFPSYAERHGAWRGGELDGESETENLKNR